MTETIRIMKGTAHCSEREKDVRGLINETNKAYDQDLLKTFFFNLAD